MQKLLEGSMLSQFHSWHAQDKKSLLKQLRRKAMKKGTANMPYYSQSLLYLSGNEAYLVTVVAHVELGFLAVFA